MKSHATYLREKGVQLHTEEKTAFSLADALALSFMQHYVPDMLIEDAVRLLRARHKREPQGQVDDLHEMYRDGVLSEVFSKEDMWRIKAFLTTSQTNEDKARAGRAKASGHAHEVSLRVVCYRLFGRRNRTYRHP